MEVSWFAIGVEIVKVLATLATTAIAGAVAIFSYRQWKIAQQKLALDVFEKRLVIFDALISALLPVIQSGAVRPEDTKAFAQAQKHALFLFDKEVNEMLMEVWRALNRLPSIEKRLTSSIKARADEAVDQQAKHFAVIDEAFRNLDKMMMPYMKMHQKTPE